MIDENQIPNEVSRQLFLLTGWIDKDCRLAIKALIDAWPNANGLPKEVDGKLQWGNNTHIMLPLKSKE